MQSIAITQTNIADSTSHSSHSSHRETAFEQAQRHIDWSQELASAQNRSSSKSTVEDGLPSQSSSQSSDIAAHSKTKADTDNISFDNDFTQNKTVNDEAQNVSEDLLQFINDAENLVTQSTADNISSKFSKDVTAAADVALIDKGQVEAQLNLADAETLAELQANSVINAELDALAHVKRNGIGELPKPPIGDDIESLQLTDNNVELVPGLLGDTDNVLRFSPDTGSQQNTFNQGSSSLTTDSAAPASLTTTSQNIGSIPGIGSGVVAHTLATQDAAELDVSERILSEQNVQNIDAEQQVDIRLNMSQFLTAAGQSGQSVNQSAIAQASGKVAPLITDQHINAEVGAVLEQANQALLQSSAIESGKDKVIPNLTAQLLSAAEENKAQLKAGKTPSVNLQDMAKEFLTEAGVKTQTIESALMSNTANTANTSTDSTPSVFSMSNLSVSNLSMNNSALNPINVSADQMQVNLEQRQAQVEQASQLKEQPGLSQLDKTINMSKPESASQLAEKVRFMVQNRQMVADVKLEPAELGAMQIRISMQGDTAAVSFVVQNAQAREAVAQGNEALRSMLEDSGLSLGDTDVQQESSQFGQSTDSSDNGSNSGSTHNVNAQSGLFEENENTGNIIAEHAIHSGNIGGIDFYA